MNLRIATDADRDYFLLLRNEPSARRASRRPLLTEEEHVRWWSKTSDHRWVCEANENQIGTLRLSWEGMVSIVIAPTSRGLGFGEQALMLLAKEARRLGYTRIFAEIAPENVRSQKAFQAAGFSPVLFELGL